MRLLVEHSSKYNIWLWEMKGKEDLLEIRYRRVPSANIWRMGSKLPSTL
jgi:hypothetical protein